ncbi:MAG: hypothetical protein R3B81_04030 [bacterium]
MTRAILGASALPFLTLGCSSTRTIATREDWAAEVDEIRSEASQRPADVTLRSGHTIHDVDLDVAVEEVRWTGPAEGASPLENVQGLRFQHYGRGAVDGLGWGVLVGLPVGLLLGATSDDDFLFDRDAQMLIGGAAFAVIGGAAGALTGSILGHDEVYRLQLDPDPGDGSEP